MEDLSKKAQVAIKENEPDNPIYRVINESVIQEVLAKDETQSYVYKKLIDISNKIDRLSLSGTNTEYIKTGTIRFSFNISPIIKGLLLDIGTCIAFLRSPSVEVYDYEINSIAEHLVEIVCYLPNENEMDKIILEIRKHSRITEIKFE